MIHVFIGTKAQFIKMAPILLELKGRGIKYNLIDTGQHAQLTDDITRQFGLREPDVRLRGRSENISTLQQAVWWTGKLIWRLLFKNQKVCENIFQGQHGVCLIHGDTLSTLISLIYSKRCGLVVAHVEAGLRSYNLFNPFPEELIRIIAMRFSDLLFAPSDWSARNLSKMGYQQKTVNIEGNTVIDSVRFARTKISSVAIPQKPYVIVTVHRVETIFSKRRMIFLVDLLEDLSDNYSILFVLHEPTRAKLDQFELLDGLLENQNIKLLNLQPYLHFLSYLEQAEFVITDGGSIQEETAYLNIPCIILRDKTERREGIGKNAVLSNFDRAIMDDFIDSLNKRISQNNDPSLQPSVKIVDHLLDMGMTERR